MKKLLSILVLFSATTYGNNPTVVSFVTENPLTCNLLFEGNLPQDPYGRFSIKYLAQALEEAYPHAFPSEYNLVIISHLTTENPQETAFLADIYNYFNGTSIYKPKPIPQQIEINQAGKGSWYWWPIRGFVAHKPPFKPTVSWATLNETYQHLTKADVTATLVNQSFEGKLLNFPSLVNLIISLMDSKKAVPQVIYAHSRRGANRNAISMSGYLMKSSGLSVEEAWDAVAPAPTAKEQVFEPQEAKSFLYYYQSYLNFFK